MAFLHLLQRVVDGLEHTAQTFDAPSVALLAPAGIVVQRSRELLMTTSPFVFFLRKNPGFCLLAPLVLCV